MIDFATHRQRLNAKLAAVKAARVPQVVLDLKGGCEHDWRKFKQTVRPQERTPAQHKRGVEWRGHQAYFVVLACERCKTKRIVNYVVER